MAEEKASGVKSVISGWIKAVCTSVFGLVTGAVIMYLTPLVNSAIKPAKPIANFAAQVSGMTVNFNDLSTGAVQGWWDFGDGSALEPFDDKLDIVKHTYAKSGTYNVKLTLKNLLGEENDRSANVTVDPETAPKPEIVSFELLPLTRDERVPAVYRMLGKVKAATHCILSAGDDRPTEILEESANLDRYLTFHEMGSYTVRLSAVNGKQLVEKSQTVFVSPSDTTDPTAKLLVTYEAVRVDRRTREMRVHCAWQPDTKGSVSPFRRERLADAGCTVLSAELVNKLDKDAPVRNASVKIGPDKNSVIVTGELFKPTGMLAPNAPPPSWLAAVKVVMESRSPPQTIKKSDMAMTVQLNSKTKLPLQPLGDGWEVLKKKVSLELWDGARKVWEGDKAVSNARVMLKNQACLVTATPQNDGFALTISATVATFAPPEPAGPIRNVGFEFKSLLPKKSK